MAVLGGIVGLLLLLILLCHLNPGLAEKIGSLFETGNTETNADIADTENNSTIEGTGLDGEPSTLTSDMLLNTPSGEKPESDETEDVNQDGTVPEGLLPEQITGYEPPEDSSLDVPLTLSGMTGYEPVSDTGEEITEPEAQQLKDELGYGNTGDGLTFDETMYPYYQMLNDTGKSLYRQIYANANDQTKAFVPVETTSQNVLKNAFMAVVNDHPEIFWVETAYTFQYTPSGTARMDLQFNQTANNLDQAKSNFNEKADEIISAAQNLGSNYDKEVQVHDDLIDGITYNLNAPMNQSAYSALVSGQTVCAGYARAYQYIMQQLEIPAYYCTGYAGENHAWNIVKLDGDYYNVDPTWDDTDPNTHDYFNCTDADFRKDHARKDLSVYLPPCNGEKYRGLIQDEVQEPESTSMDTAQESSENNGERLTSMEDYYQDCYDQAMAATGTTISFSNVVEDRSLARQIYGAYQSGDYRDGFMLKMMEDKGFTQSSVDLSLQEQDDGSYVLTHTIKASK